MGSVGSIILVTLGLIILASAGYFLTRKNEKKLFNWFYVPALLLAIFSLMTSWIWLYYFSLYSSLPALIVSLLLGFLAFRISRNWRVIRPLLIVQMAAIFIGLLGALFFRVI